MNSAVVKHFRNLLQAEPIIGEHQSSLWRDRRGFAFTWKKRIRSVWSKSMGLSFSFWKKKKKDLRLSPTATDAFELPGIFYRRPVILY